MHWYFSMWNYLFQRSRDSRNSNKKSSYTGNPLIYLSNKHCVQTEHINLAVYLVKRSLYEHLWSKCNMSSATFVGILREVSLFRMHCSCICMMTKCTTNAQIFKNQYNVFVLTYTILFNALFPKFSYSTDRRILINKQDLISWSSILGLF